ncbi:hypothetical protein N309_04765, partial [Tinamus guttatus]
QGSVQRGLEDGRRRRAHICCHGVTLLHPVPEATVQHRDLFVPEDAEHPPGTGRVEGAQLVPVVYHHVGVVADAQVPHIVGEVGLAGQHEVVRGRLVPALLNVKKRGSGDVPLPELLPGVPLLRRVPRGIQRPQ